MASRLDRIYSSSPVWLQQIGINAFGVVWKNRRYGGAFKRAVSGFESRDNYTTNEWTEYQTEHLQRLLLHAAENVPYYRRLFGDAGLATLALERFTRSDLEQLPRLAKEDLRSRPDEFIAKNGHGRQLHTYSTSGTTGTPLSIKYTSEMHQTWTAAYEVRCRRWAGLNYEMSRAMIGGRNIVPVAKAGQPLWRYNYAERQLYLSAFHISPANVPGYVEALNHYQPDYLTGYASAHFALAKLILDQSLAVYQPRCILTSSEKLLPEMRTVIETAYRAPVYDGYSGVEACCLASECEYHRLHVSPDVGIIELLNEDGSPAQPGQPGEIVATGLLNFAQPLIRYRTGDLAIWSDDPCPCGRQMPVLREIYGRQEDVVILRDGRRSSSFYKVFQGIEGIREAQVIQEDYDHFNILVVAADSFNPDQREQLLRNVTDRYGAVRVEIKTTDHIERTKNGKLRLLVSKVNDGAQRKERTSH
jgi:phenylacetate-CoA ligase